MTFPKRPEWAQGWEMEMFNNVIYYNKSRHLFFRYLWCSGGLSNMYVHLHNLPISLSVLYLTTGLSAMPGTSMTVHLQQTCLGKWAVPALALDDGCTARGRLASLKTQRLFPAPFLSTQCLDQDIKEYTMWNAHSHLLLWVWSSDILRIQNQTVTSESETRILEIAMIHSRRQGIADSSFVFKQESDIFSFQTQTSTKNLDMTNNHLSCSFLYEWELT